MQASLRAAFRAQTRFALSRPTVQPARVHLFRTLVTKKYTKDHEIVAFDDASNIGTVYITNHAQQSLGDVVFVELPNVGEEITKDDPIGAVESVKAASDIYAPISGKVTEVNETLSKQPNLVNKSAEKDGWLCKVELSDPSELDDLLSEEDYTKSLAE